MIENSELRKVLGENVRRLRKEKGRTQEQLAQEVGISAVFMNRIEQGHSSPSAEVAFALADALAVSTDVLRQLPLKSAS